MKFTVSTVNPQPRTPLLVLTHDGERVLVNTPDTYEELERVARAEFRLADETLIFHTSDLDICEEQSVRIHRGAWDIVRSLTGSIAVTAVARVPLEADRDYIVPDAAASYNVPGALEPLAEPEYSPIHQGEDVPTSTRMEQNVINSLPSPCSSSIQSRRDHQQGDPSLKDQGSNSDSDRSDNASMRVKSPKRKQVRRQVMTDDEDDSDHHMDEPDQPDDHNDDEDRGSVFENIPKKHDQGSVVESGPSQKRFKYIPKVKEEPISGGVSFQKEKTQSQKRSGGSQIDNIAGGQEENIQESTLNHAEDERLLVSIAHRPTKQQAIFKTKGQTRVGKVLSGACKSFKLDYESARLLLIVTMEEDGETLEHFFECDKEETMARVGAEKASSFIIETTR